MAYETEIDAMLSRLAGAWLPILRRHGLTTMDRAGLLGSPTIDRAAPGFEDFAPSAAHWIEPGVPEHSLLYHALACGRVDAGDDPTAYPTLQELDTLENHILSLRPLDPTSIPADAVVAVMAYEYRDGRATAHLVHADFAYARTGIARVGTRDIEWSGRARGFVAATNDSTQVRTLPARYAAFIAAPRRGLDGFSIMDELADGDRDRTFLVPIRKLFAGDGCIAGATLSLSFSAHHVSEKLARLVDLERLHDKLKPRGLDLGAAPFRLVDGDVATVMTKGASALVIPRTRANLADYAEATNPATGRIEKVRFEVPSAGFPLSLSGNDSMRRHFSSYMVVESIFGLARDALFHKAGIGSPRPRNAPEFVNIRHLVAADGVSVEHADTRWPNPATLRDHIRAGGYDAALFLDGTGEGCVTAEVSGLPRALPMRPAFSVVAPPDLLAAADEKRMSDWAQANYDDEKDHFASGSPVALCRGRRRVNPRLRLPDGAAAFADRSDTMVAVLGTRPRPRGKPPCLPWYRVSNSYLTDHSSNVFAPGWDLTVADLDDDELYYATFGLGSPYLEDLKLCAAANAYWPAVSPDASRTFNRDTSPTAVPLMDGELGYHPRCPYRPAAAPQTAGWDGEYSPYFEEVDGALHVNYCDIYRSDYVRTALAGRFRAGALAGLTTDELIGRMGALAAAIAALPERPPVVADTELLLVRAEAATGVYRFYFAKLSGAKPRTDPGDMLRLRRRTTDSIYVCDVTARIPHVAKWRHCTTASTLAAPL